MHFYKENKNTKIEQSYQVHSKTSLVACKKMKQRETRDTGARGRGRGCRERGVTRAGGGGGKLGRKGPVVLVLLVVVRIRASDG